MLPSSNRCVYFGDLPGLPEEKDIPTKACRNSDVALPGSLTFDASSGMPPITHRRPAGSNTPEQGSGTLCSCNSCRSCSVSVAWSNVRSVTTALPSTTAAMVDLCHAGSNRKRDEQIVGIFNTFNAGGPEMYNTHSLKETGMERYLNCEAQR